MKIKTVVFSWLPLVVFLGGLGFWVSIFEMRRYAIIDNLLWYCIPIAAAAAVLVFRIISKQKEVHPQLKNPFSLLPLFLGFMLATWSIAVVINGVHASESTREQYSLVVGKQKSTMRYTRHYLSFQIDREAVEFKVPLELWDSLDEGDTVLLRMKTGALGYDFVDEIIPVKSAAPQPATP